MKREVELSQPEMCMAIEVAKMRRMDSFKKGLTLGKNSGEKDKRSWDWEIDGAAAELVVAKELGRYWSGPVGNFKEGDIGERIQVRHTNRMDGKLIIREDDKNEHYFVLVRGKMPSYEVVGYINGAEAKLDKFLFGPNGAKPAYFIPSSELKPFPDK
jgi:hypothetical protein